MNKIIADNIRKIRINKEITQKNLCDKLILLGYDIKRNTYSKYENGTRTVPCELLYYLAIYYNISTDYFFKL